VAVEVSEIVVDVDVSVITSEYAHICHLVDGQLGRGTSSIAIAIERLLIHHPYRLSSSRLSRSLMASWWQWLLFIRYFQMTIRYSCWSTSCHSF